MTDTALAPDLRATADSCLKRIANACDRAVAKGDTWDHAVAAHLDAIRIEWPSAYKLLVRRMDEMIAEKEGR